MCVYYYHIIITFCNKVSKIQENNCKVNDCSSITTACPYCDSHSTSISACGGQGPGFKSLGGSFTHIYT